MKKITKITIALLAIFVIGMTISMAFADPVSAAKYKGKKSITVKVKDGKKTIKVKCRYKSGYGGSYHGQKGKYIVDVWKGPKQSPIYNGWNTQAKNLKTHKACNMLGHKKPVTTLKLRYYV
ncbi:MAG: hypothetical protein VZR10_08220 [Methanobrevibacter sp.]|nr:hypothetical protein [Methanobrevibacter sp.]